MDKKIASLEAKTEKRIQSLMNSNAVISRKVEANLNAKNIITESETRIINPDSTYLIALISEFDCAKCQENELLKIQEIKSDLRNLGIQTLCITIKEKVNQINVQRKFLKLDMPFYYIKDDLFEKLSVDKKYPQILLVNKGIIVSAFKPITKDFEFSEMFYKQLLEKLFRENGT